MKVDIWKPINNYNGFYQISNRGDVRSVDRKIELSNTNTRLLKAKQLKTRINNYGYLTVRLSKSGVTKTQFIHRLVADAYIPNMLNLPEVNHKNGVKSDNTPSNLEWVSHSQNVQHAYNIGLNTHIQGNHKFAVGVIDNQIGKVFSNIKDWSLARGINYSTGRNILNGFNTSKTIDLSQIVQLKNKSNGK